MCFGTFWERVCKVSGRFWYGLGRFSTEVFMLGMPEHGHEAVMVGEVLGAAAEPTA